MSSSLRGTSAVAPSSSSTRSIQVVQHQEPSRGGGVVCIGEQSSASPPNSSCNRIMQQSQPQEGKGVDRSKVDSSIASSSSMELALPRSPHSSTSNPDLTSLAAVALAASSTVVTDQAASSANGPQQTVEPSALVTSPPQPPTNGVKSPRSRTAPLNPTTSASSKPANGGATSASKLLRRGKWTAEEETYVARVIQDFNLGYLKAPAGTTLRSYLSEKLQCDPMRITKKFTGDACIGKRVFHPAVPTTAATLAAMKQAQAELEDLELQWRRRMELQQSESAKKAAASAAAVAAGCMPADGTTLIRAASWLEKAKETLVATNATVSSDESSSSTGRPSTTREEIVKQMNEVQKLLVEGPTTSAIARSRRGSNSAVSSTTTTPTTTVSATPATSAEKHGGANLFSHSDSKTSEPASSGTKRHRPDDSLESPTQRQVEAEEDAQALVNFLQTVQAAASKGTTH
mmetsp:Transcript_26787/g.61612  ORF Transcript_26787/g.61612 Transcript_26787/m.61612 type:complete len:460 (-) Transcript_26787:162-1541(-)